MLPLFPELFFEHHSGDQRAGVKDLIRHVGGAIAKRGLIQRGERVLVAVSGGLDSMVLLALLGELAKENGWKLCVGHFNHGLRGRASDADEKFVKQAAEKLGVRFVTERGAVKELAKERGISIEMAARELRHGFFARAAKKLKCGCVATAHHADDQAELFFLRLFRGAGADGLSGMKWKSASPVDARLRIVRPLLDVGRGELEKFAWERGIKFREDATNASKEILRNRIRHELLPLVRRKYQGGINQTLARVMEIVGAEGEVVEGMAREWLERRKPAFSKLAVAVQRRVVQLQLRELKIAEEFELIEALRTVPNVPVTVTPKLRIEREANGGVRLVETFLEQFATNGVSFTVRPKGRVAFDGLRVVWAKKEVAGKQYAGAVGCEEFDAEKVGDKIILRHWRPGDRFQPIGFKSSVKLQDWFTNRKVPRTKRTHLAIATIADGTIFWVEGERIGEGFKLCTGTKVRLIWEWKRG